MGLDQWDMRPGLQGYRDVMDNLTGEIKQECSLPPRFGSAKGTGSAAEVIGAGTAVSWTTNTIDKEPLAPTGQHRKELKGQWICLPWH